MISYTLPAKSARQFSGAGVVVAPVSGLYYTFDESVLISNTVSGYVYYLEKISFSPSVPEYQYTAAVDLGADIPVSIVQDQNGVPQNPNGVKLVSVMAQAPLELWYSSDSSGALYLKVKGRIKQTSDFVGIPEIRLAVSVTGYELAADMISGAYRNGVSAKALSQFRGGV